MQVYHTAFLPSEIYLKLTNISLNKIYVQKKSSIPLGVKRKIWNILDKPRMSIIHKEIAQILNEYNDSGTSWKWTTPYSDRKQRHQKLNYDQNYYYFTNLLEGQLSMPPFSPDCPFMDRSTAKNVLRFERQFTSLGSLALSSLCTFW